MSRIGKKTIKIPENVKIELKDGEITVTGPKGTLTRKIHPAVKVSIEEGIVKVSVGEENNKFQRSLWGTFSSHIKNMVDGVTQGFKKQLEINGVGYRVALQGKELRLDVGYSHPVMYSLPELVLANVEKNVITLESIDKEKLGQVASEIRAVRKPEPYKGKGIKYMEEVIRRKAGKTAKTA